MGPALSARCVGMPLCGPSLITELYLTGPTHPTRYSPAYSTQYPPWFLWRTVLLFACIAVTSAPSSPPLSSLLKLSATASMSSAFRFHKHVRFPASKCVDGHLEWEFCSTSTESDPWLTLDLGTTIQLAYVAVYNRLSLLLSYPLHRPVGGLRRGDCGGGRAWPAAQRVPAHGTVRDDPAAGQHAGYPGRQRAGPQPRRGGGLLVIPGWLVPTGSTCDASSFYVRLV